MLMLRPLKGFMYLFSSLLFKAFSLTLMFSLYHTAFWLHLTRGQSVHAFVLGITCLKYSTSLLWFHQQTLIWAWHTVSAFAFCLCTLAGVAVEQDGILYWVWLYLSVSDFSFALNSQAELPQYWPPEPHVLSWCGPAQCSHHQYLNPHRPELHAESLCCTWAALQQPGHWAGPDTAGLGPSTDSWRSERTGPATTAASTADEIHQCTW